MTVIFWKVTAILPCKPWKATLNRAPRGWRSKRRSRIPVLFLWRWEKLAGAGSCSILQQGVRGWAPEGKLAAAVPWKASQRVTWCKLLGKCCNCVTEMAEPQCSGKGFSWWACERTVPFPGAREQSGKARDTTECWESSCSGKGSCALFQDLKCANLWLRARNKRYN